LSAKRQLHLVPLRRGAVDLGWVLDPLAAIMLVMVSFVGLLIFIYSVGYMAHDENFTRFFCFLSLFAGAMLGVVISNSLLLLFMCWEIVGLTRICSSASGIKSPPPRPPRKKPSSPRASATSFFLSRHRLAVFADRHACSSITTAWVRSKPLSLAHQLLTHTQGLGLSAAGAIGCSSLPERWARAASFHCTSGCPTPWKAPRPSPRSFTRPPWLPPAFILSRAFIRSCRPAPRRVERLRSHRCRTWVGAATAVFAALIAVAQNDIKRILAYSTVSQLGYMMAGLGLGGVAVGMFHLITHAFFKALLFLGAGSVIHGCHEEQDIRRMGGLKADMPLTFITYAIGMLALCGFPIFFSGFWSKDGILEAAQHWSVRKRPVLSAGLRRAAHSVLYDAPGLLRLLRLLARP
jgi:NADH-quinone oxidoreductase subunit L